jgi:hypothetical protein
MKHCVYIENVYNIKKKKESEREKSERMKNRHLEEGCRDVEEGSN